MEFIREYMPDWIVRILIGLAIWFVLCYYIITPFIYDRVTIPLRKFYIEEISKVNKYWKYEQEESKLIEYANCLYFSYYIENVYEITQWVSSGTFYKPKAIYSMEKLINTPTYQETCGNKPWKQ